MYYAVSCLMLHEVLQWIASKQAADSTHVMGGKPCTLCSSRGLQL
jgi:hypothetical protein